MQILTYGYEKENNEYPRVIQCNHCDATFLIDEDDTYEGYRANTYVECPVCTQQNLVSELHDSVDVDNIKFPIHFFHFGNGVDVENKEIEEAIGYGVSYLKNHKDSEFWTWATGNTKVFITKNVEETEIWYDVTVAKDYWEIDVC